LLAENEIWIIGTEPPCPRCDYLTKMVHEVTNYLNLAVRVRHLSYKSAEARELAESLGLEAGTAKDVAVKAGLKIDWDQVHQLLDDPKEGKTEAPTESCCPSAAARWTPELDQALRPCQEQAGNVGIMMTPVLVVSGRICHQGSVPSPEETKDWIMQAFMESQGQDHEAVIVEVLGPGCANCERLYQNVFEALKGTGLNGRVQVKKMTDLDYFMEKGVYVTPGLIINGQVVSTGKSLDSNQIAALLSDILESNHKN
jgi:hypothetical protein